VDFVPAYVKAFEEGILQEGARRAVESLRSCRVCPRDCEVDRFNNKVGVCKSGRLARVASAFPHFGEEDCLRGWRGSGTIFLSWCNLRCVFCQNCDISQQGDGTEVTAEELARLMIELQAAGCHNVNFVTPEHVVPQILEALVIAVGRGLQLPLVYNTSAYDSLESLRLMDGLVDIYMPDFKLWHAEHCAKYLMARDYPDAARSAIAAMHAQVGELKVDEDGLALRGVLVRHLVMPGLLEDTREIMHWLATELSRDTYVNVMDQYRPAWKAKSEPRFTEINRSLKPSEFERAIECAHAAGLWRLDERWFR
jgi:putative pyruvate formate lyase activating enzyme